MHRLSIALMLGVFLLAQTVCVGLTPASAGRNVAAEGEEIDIVGRYTYKATIPGGEETGTVEIQKHGDAYKLEWVRDGKRGKYRGVAIRTQDTLSVCYSYPGNGERGVGVFKITSGPKLMGQWSMLGGDGKLSSDTWTAKK